jgi:hypothetical protein
VNTVARDIGPADSARRLERYAWSAVEAQLNARGWAVLEQLLDADECTELARSYDREECFRSRVVMQRHGYGQGEYRYFSYPLPGLVADLRGALYGPLSGIANRWQQALGRTEVYPSTHEEFLAICRAAGQTRPTPLLLRYGAGDYNCLHQDLYGEQVFPLQVAVLLSQPGVDFSGGELVLTEQRPRMQSRPHVVPLRRGDAVVFAVRERPVQGARGFYRTAMRHGVSELHDGQRHTLGIIFHDAL